MFGEFSHFTAGSCRSALRWLNAAAVFWLLVAACAPVVWASHGTPTQALTAQLTPDAPPNPGEPPRAGMPLNGTYAEMPLADWASQWLDPQGKADGADAKTAARAGAFARVADAPVVLATEAAMWYRLEIQQRDRTGRWYVRSISAAVDHMSFHWQNPQGQWQSQVAGDSVPSRNWPIKHRLPSFEIPTELLTEPDGTAEVWLRIAQKRTAFFTPITVLNDASMRKASETGYWFFGVFYGLVFAALVLAAQRVFATRDRAFFAFGLYTLSMALLQGALTGLIGQYVLDDLPRVADQLPRTAAELFALGGLYFAYTACNVERFVPRIAWFYRAWMSLGLGVVTLHIVWSSATSFAIANVYMPSSLVLALAAPVLAHRRGERYALQILFSMLPAALMSLLPLARNHSLITTSFWTQYGLMIGAAVQLVALMVVLNRRSHELHESEVRERALSSTDALTGVTHEQLFLERLHGSVVRARRYGHQTGLLLITLTNHGWFQKEHGQQSAERALVLTASRIRAVARDVDTVSRVGEREFVMLLEGPVTHAGMVHAATKVLARSLQPAEALPIGAQLKIAITMAVLPDKPGMKIEDETEEGLSAQNRVEWLRQRSAARLDEPHAKPIQALNF
jgi:two-component system, sensor histidine kinase LadS